MMKALQTIFVDRSPEAKRKTATELLSAGEARLRNLEQARGTALTDGDSIEEALGLDREIAQQRTTNETYRERIKALEGVQQRVDIEQRERERTEAIDKVVVPAVAEIETLAKQFQARLLDMIGLYEQIHQKRADLMSNWPEAAPKVKFSSLYLSYLGPDLFGHTRSSPRGSGEAFVQTVRYHGNQIAEAAAREAATFIEDARRTKIPKFESDDDAEAA